ncbi:conserved hypothetical protein [Burkholderia pseudomallei S13]|nr:conserved hypothetical protein [Burkholderia pseudomallei S13]
MRIPAPARERERVAARRRIEAVRARVRGGRRVRLRALIVHSLRAGERGHVGDPLQVAPHEEHVADVDRAERGDGDQHPDRRDERERAALARDRPAPAGGRAALGAAAG